ncbi:MAG TPA: cation-translocating P-type ATPase [Nocardioidaceae bacterium]|nr:cation-translocating P-type ATPase [Nocardioidaceae bacterium]
MTSQISVRTGDGRGLGLSTREAEEALAQVGANRLPDPPGKGTFGRALEQLRDPMILLLVAAGVLTIALGDTPDSIIIWSVVAFNTAMGVIQQRRADRAMAALQTLTRPVSRVFRDGALTDLPSELVVPGDAVALVAGDVVPADGTVLDSAQLQANQAIMTGESLPVDLADGDDLIGGTSITRGRATMVVTRTGSRSGIGSIAAMLAETSARATPLQRRLARLSRALVLLVSALVGVVVVSGLVRGHELGEMAVVGLSLAVAAVPESLPAVVTIALAMGAHRMARRNAVIRHLPAVETLGSVTVVATDKTGTITEGTMVVQALWTPGSSYTVTGEGYAPTGRVEPERPIEETDRDLAALVRDVALCNDAVVRLDDGTWTVDGDPLEGALITLAAKAGVSATDVQAHWWRTCERPFDHQTLMMSTDHVAPDGQQLTVCKGAPEAVLARVDDRVTQEAARAAAAFAQRGLRVLAVADDEGVTAGSLRLRGLVAVGDPPRAHARKVVGQLQDAGVRLVLLTGDHAGTAGSIARQVGILPDDEQPVEGRDLAALDRGDVTRVAVVARVRPEEKVTVVEALLGSGEVVAMIGDGVNDAPALRRADIGVAAGKGGSEVARQAADLVLMDDDLSTVVAAVEEGRRILSNIRAFLVYALSGGLAEVGVMLLGPAVGLVLPLLPAQILWINLVTHGMTGVAFGSEPASPDAMRRAPTPPDAPIFLPAGRRLLVLATVALTAVTLTVVALSEGSDAERRTAAFLVLGLGQLGVALALRARLPHRARRERGLDLAVTLSAVMLALGCVVPVLRELLGTVALDLPLAFVLVAVAAVPGLLVRAVLVASR